MKQLSPEERMSCKKSIETISSIDALIANPEFQIFMGKIKELSDKMADSILHEDEISDQEREAKRQRRLGILEVLRKPQEDRDNHVRLLAQFGVKPGDGVEIGI
ncbi:hypothetical protein JIN85_14695 [Luteolibacter pohnpeiensis]|uniref:Uncharacterized protein n=1 Tax=Luteolibacter pohnpeiensis TaxID=454153 RepID=A0A934S7L2_9BACT|nr:hypothetical protein [Luteolibacter pohnpeiensis]MBK1883667.1 hypothetical protein [Luteolibacter pohnpeiensis]